MVIVPYQLDTNDMKMWLAPSYTPSQWLEYAMDTLAQCQSDGAHQPMLMSLGLHLRIIGRPGRIGALETFLRHATSQPKVWCARRIDIAQAFAKAVPQP
jgi:allantoinase